MANEPEQVDINIQEDLDVDQRAWLVAKLEQETGIVSAWFTEGSHHRLTLHFEPEHFSHETLLDTIKLQGFHGKIEGRRLSQGDNANSIHRNRVKRTEQEGV